MWFSLRILSAEMTHCEAVNIKCEVFMVKGCCPVTYRTTLCHLLSTFTCFFPRWPAQDCPADVGDFRAQQCSAHADVRHQGQYHEWLPVYNDPDNPCALKCKAKGSGLVVELAPKVLDGTRCYTESLDMCISGVCQVGQRLFRTCL